MKKRSPGIAGLGLWYCQLTLSFALSFLCLSFSGFSQTGEIIDTGWGPGHRKLSPPLLTHLSSISNEQNVNVEVLLNDTSMIHGWYIHQSDKFPQFIQLSKNDFIGILSLTKTEVLNLSRQDQVIAIELARKPLVELKQEGLDLTLNEVTFLHHSHPQLAGTNMVLSIREDLFDTTDIDFKNRIIKTELASDQIKIHATNMASIAAGGGNSGPMSKGVAWDAFISSSDFKSLLPDPDSHFIRYGISVQNHAYGTDIENYYGIESAAYDALTNRLPDLLHVFSSGNAGEQMPAEGKYAGLSRWANLTGHFKQSKNTITVGATDSLDQILDLSSAGPAYDGRIKPEVVAYGHGGSSGSAAIVSGISLLIQEAYLLSFGVLPPSSLIKAVLINSSQDIATEGPDYKSGYGSVRAYEAVQTVEENHFIVSSINSDELKIIPITIPAGLSKAKFTIAWNDPANETLSPKSLVNDINMRLEEVSSGIPFNPWVLSSFPAEDSLMQPARKGPDTLNNIEQINIESPAPGDYNIYIQGEGMQTSSQEFSLVWQFDSQNEFRWTFPTKDDYLVPSAKNTIRWKPVDMENGIIEYRKIGENWTPVDNNVDPSTGFLIWTPQLEGLAQMRWSNGQTVVLSDTFVVSTPVDPDVVFVCPDSFLFRWRNPGIVDSFQIVKLGLKHLEHYDYTNDTFYLEDDVNPDHPFYAVFPVYDDLPGPPSYTFDYRQQGAGCFLDVFYLRHVLNGHAFFAANLGLIEGIDSVVLQEKIHGTFKTIQALDQIDDTALFFESGLLKQGINYFRLKIVLENGKEIISQEVSVYYVGDSDVWLFPNPASFDQEIILLTKEIQDFDLQVFDIAGKLIHEERQLSSPILFSAGRLVPGSYIISISSEAGLFYFRVLHVYR